MQRFWIIGLTIFLSLQLAVSQNIADDINQSFSKGDATALSKYFNQNIELIISGKGDFYNKNQAAMIMKDFFKNNHPVTYERIHKGEKDDSIFLIEKLTTANKSYRISILLKKTDEVFLIHQIRIQNV